MGYKLEPLHPRLLNYRFQNRLLQVILVLAMTYVASVWVLLHFQGWGESTGMWIVGGATLVVGLGIAAYQYFAKKSKHWKTVQVFPDHIAFHFKGKVQDVFFKDVVSVKVLFKSHFVLSFSDGNRFYFSSALERVDYVWEGLKRCRPELMSPEAYEAFRVKLIQYDHHEKRKEWFFEHKLVDTINWILLPGGFLVTAYAIQSQKIVIHHLGLYFFRLGMYSLLVLIVTTVLFSWIFKKFVFDKVVELQLGGSSEKLRDMEFESVVLQRSKLLQTMSACFVFMLILKVDVNLFSIAKIKDDLGAPGLKRGHTVLVDNRYNCFGCEYPLIDGDLIVFGRGIIGQVMAKGGESVGEVQQDKRGRMIASHQVVEVPARHVAVKTGTELVFVKIEDVIGKIQK